MDTLKITLKNQDNLIETLKNKENQILQQQQRINLLTNNMHSFLQEIPCNHKGRPYILQHFIQGLEKQEAANIFNMHETSIVRIQRMDRPERLLPLLAWKGQREMISIDRRELWMDIINEIIPVVSGREYRIRTCRLQVLYIRYVDRATHRAPSKRVIGYGKFKKLLRKEKVHYGKKPTLCYHCMQIEDGVPLTKQLEFHIDAKARQQPCYVRLKRWLIDGLLPEGSAIAIQDFTQIDLESGFVQDEIVCLYIYCPTSKDKIMRLYFDVVGEKELKNGIAFVIHAWLKLFSLPEFQRITHLYIWSDGGPKHYKISANILFWAVMQVLTKKSLQKSLHINLILQMLYPQKFICYNFFASNHGHSVCDGLAKHGKERLTRLRCEENERIENHEVIVRALNGIKNRTAFPMPCSVQQAISVDTLDGIKSYHQFFFPSPLTICAAHFSSFDTTEFKCPQKDISWNVTQADWDLIYRLIIGEKEKEGAS